MQTLMTNTFTPTATDAAFSSLDQVGQCLMDRERSEAFDRAIRSVVQRNHTVLDAGTGSGLLALFAARAGARRVIALEYDPYIATVARANIRANGYEHITFMYKIEAKLLSGLIFARGGSQEQYLPRHPIPPFRHYQPADSSFLCHSEESKSES